VRASISLVFLNYGYSLPQTKIGKPFFKKNNVEQWLRVLGLRLFNHQRNAEAHEPSRSPRCALHDDPGYGRSALGLDATHDLFAAAFQLTFCTAGRARSSPAASRRGWFLALLDAPFKHTKFLEEATQSDGLFYYLSDLKLNLGHNIISILHP
jgi:hypothetical protein